MRLRASFLFLFGCLIQAHAQANQYEVEPNNSLQVANAIRRNTNVNGQLYAALDSDFYRFKPGGVNAINVFFRCTVPLVSGNYNLYSIALYNEYGNLQSRYSISNQQCVNRNFRTRLYMPNLSGTYYLSVSVTPTNLGAMTNPSDELLTDYNYILRLGSPITKGAPPAGPCPIGQQLVKIPIPFDPTNRAQVEQYCPNKIPEYCHPYKLECQ